MKMLVTGSSGFLGKATVQAALQAGHEVRALVRPSVNISGIKTDYLDHIEIFRGDLRTKESAIEACKNVDVVLHLAAIKQGDFYDQMVGTVVATENLLNAMVETGIKRLVLTSTFSVYDTLRMRSWSLLDESSPIETNPKDRDDYAQTKLLQENLVKDFSKSHDLALTILRPGMLYGRDNLFNARVGVEAGKHTWVRLGGIVLAPLNYVENCAEAIVLAAEREEAIGKIFNVIDDDLPTQSRYARLLRKNIAPGQRIIPIPWPVMRVLARSIWIFNHIFLKGKAKVPGILRPGALHARAKPFRYSNKFIKQTLGWKPRYTLKEALDRSLSKTPIYPFIAQSVQ